MISALTLETVFLAVETILKDGHRMKFKRQFIMNVTTELKTTLEVIGQFLLGSSQAYKASEYELHHIKNLFDPVPGLHSQTVHRISRQAPTDKALPVHVYVYLRKYSLL